MLQIRAARPEDVGNSKLIRGLAEYEREPLADERPRSRVCCAMVSETYPKIPLP